MAISTRNVVGVMLAELFQLVRRHCGDTGAQRCNSAEGRVLEFVVAAAPSPWDDADETVYNIPERLAERAYALRDAIDGDDVAALHDSLLGLLAVYALSLGEGGER